MFGRIIGAFESIGVLLIICYLSGEVDKNSLYIGLGFILLPIIFILLMEICNSKKNTNI